MADAQFTPEMEKAFKDRNMKALAGLVRQSHSDRDFSGVSDKDLLQSWAHDPTVMSKITAIRSGSSAPSGPPKAPPVQNSAFGGVTQKANEHIAKTTPATEKEVAATLDPTAYGPQAHQGGIRDASISANPRSDIWGVIRDGAIGKALHINTQSEAGIAAEKKAGTDKSLFRGEALSTGPGAIRGAGEFVTEVSTPGNISLMLAGGGLEKVLGKTLVTRLAVAGFTASMVKGLYNESPDLKKAIDVGDWPMVRQKVTKMALEAEAARRSSRRIGDANIHEGFVYNEQNSGLIENFRTNKKAYEKAAADHENLTANGRKASPEDLQKSQDAKSAAERKYNIAKEQLKKNRISLPGSSKKETTSNATAKSAEPPQERPPLFGGSPKPTDENIELKNLATPELKEQHPIAERESRKLQDRQKYLEDQHQVAQEEYDRLEQQQFELKNKGVAKRSKEESSRLEELDKSLPEQKKHLDGLKETLGSHRTEAEKARDHLGEITREAGRRNIKLPERPIVKTEKVVTPETPVFGPKIGGTKPAEVESEPPKLEPRKEVPWPDAPPPEPPAQPKEEPPPSDLPPDGGNPPDVPPPPPPTAPTGPPPPPNTPPSSGPSGGGNAPRKAPAAPTAAAPKPVAKPAPVAPKPPISVLVDHIANVNPEWIADPEWNQDGTRANANFKDTLKKRLNLNDGEIKTVQDELTKRQSTTPPSDGPSGGGNAPKPPIKPAPAAPAAPLPPKVEAKPAPISPKPSLVSTPEDLTNYIMGTRPEWVEDPEWNKPGTRANKNFIDRLKKQFNLNDVESKNVQTQLEKRKNPRQILKPREVPPAAATTTPPEVRVPEVKPPDGKGGTVQPAMPESRPLTPEAAEVPKGLPAPKEAKPQATSEQIAELERLKKENAALKKPTAKAEPKPAAEPPAPKKTAPPKAKKPNTEKHPMAALWTPKADVIPESRPDLDSTSKPLSLVSENLEPVKPQGSTMQSVARGVAHAKQMKAKKATLTPLDANGKPIYMKSENGEIISGGVREINPSIIANGGIEEIARHMEEYGAKSILVETGSGKYTTKIESADPAEAKHVDAVNNKPAAPPETRKEAEDNSKQLEPGSKYTTSDDGEEVEFTYNGRGMDTSGEYIHSVTIDGKKSDLTEEQYKELIAGGVEKGSKKR